MSLLDDLEKAKDKATETVKDTADNVGNAVDETVDKAVETGQDVAEDVSQGAQDVAGDVAEAGGDVAEGAQDVAKEVSEGDVSGAVDEVVETGQDVASGRRDTGSSSGGSSSSSSGSDRDPGRDITRDRDSGDNNTNRDSAPENQKQQKNGNKSSSRNESRSQTQGNRQGSNRNENQKKDMSDLQERSDWFTDTNQEYVQKYYERARNMDPTDTRRDPPGPTGTQEQLQGPRLQELSEKANLDFSEELVLQLQAGNQEFNEKAEDVVGDRVQELESKSPVDVPYWDTSEFVTGMITETSDAALSGGALVGQTGKVIAPLNPTDGPIYSQNEDGDVVINTENLQSPDIQESMDRAGTTDDLVVKGGQQFAENVKQNPEKALSGEVYPEVAGALIGGTSVTTSKSTKTPDNVNVDIQESYLPDLDQAKGETLQKARVKQGAGKSNTGAETSQGRSVTRQAGEKAQTEGEQPGLHGKVEYELDGKQVREDYMGKVDTRSETTVNTQDGSANPMEGTKFDYQKEGQARVELEKIGENGEMGVKGQDQVIIDDVQAEGQGQTDPFMVQADPDGGLKVGYEKQTGETGKVGDSDYTSVSKETGVKDLDEGVGKSTSETRTSSDTGTSEVESKNVKIDTEKLPDADKVRKGRGDGSSTESKDFQDLAENQDVDPQNSDLAEEMGIDQKSDTSRTKDSGTDRGPDYDSSDYDGSGETVQIKRNPDQDSSSTTDVGPDSDSTATETMRKALEDKVKDKDVDVKSRDVDVGLKGTVGKDDIQVNEQDQNLDQDLGRDQSQREEQEQKQPPEEDTIEIETNDYNFGDGTSRSGQSSTSSFSFSSSTTTSSSTKTPSVSFDDQDVDPMETDDDVLKGEKGREYRASLDAEILGIRGEKKEYGLGTRPIVEDGNNGNGEIEKKEVDINSRDDSLL